jgi:hypothetical protein
MRSTSFPASCPGQLGKTVRHRAVGADLSHGDVVIALALAKNTPPPHLSWSVSQNDLQKRRHGTA